MNDKQNKTSLLSAEIKLARKQAGLTQKELAEKLNISQTVINQWERGARTAKISSLQKIADALGMTITDLYDFETPVMKDCVFPDRLRAARKCKGMTQAELANKCHCMDVQIRKYESGQSEPTLSRLVQLARGLDVSLDWLCGLTENTPYALKLQTDIQEAENLVEELKRLKDQVIEMREKVNG